MKELKLSNSDLVTIVDDDVYERVRHFRWRLDKFGRVRRKIYVGSENKKPKYKDLYLHYEFREKKEGLMTDHINRNPLDNRRENLRYCTASQNQANKVKKNVNPHGYRGVTKSRGSTTYHARICKEGKYTTVSGGFKTPKEAALAYNKIALELHGEFAILNKNI